MQKRLFGFSDRGAENIGQMVIYALNDFLITRFSHG